MSGKVIVITGASSGIGATLTKRLDTEGHALVLAARDPEKLTMIQTACHGRTVAVPTDVTRRVDVDRLRDGAIAAFGHVDVWVNNAGRGIDREVLDLSDEDIDEMFLINTKAALYGMQTIVPYFKARGRGHVINVSSMLSRVPTVTFRAAYSAAKAALNVLTASVRLDLQRSHPEIHVSLIFPGSVPTAFQKSVRGGTAVRPPSGPAAPQTPEEVAAVIARVIDSPVSETYTSATLESIAGRYQQDVAAFERSLITPAP